LDGMPVSIRLLVPPLHEFLPHSPEDRKALASHLGVDLEVVVERGDKLHEFNPMLGHRGCRLGVTYPEIYEMQVQAIIEAALAAADQGVSVNPEIMIPLIATAAELEILRTKLTEVAETILERAGKKLSY